VRTKRGFARLECQKLRERNEALDCRVYARAAAWIIGADRWSEARWVDLETQVAGDSSNNADQDKGAAAGSIRAVRSPARRRSVASNYMR
jgi:phage terminase large subunit GpA-like protein